MGINDFGLHTIRANPPWDEQWTIKVATYWTVQLSMQYEYAAKLLNPSPTPSKYLTVVARFLIRYKTWYVPRTQVTKSLSTRYPCSTYKCLSIYILGTCHICTFDEQKTFIARSLSLWRRSGYINLQSVPFRLDNILSSPSTALLYALSEALHSPRHHTGRWLLLRQN